MSDAPLKRLYCPRCPYRGEWGAAEKPDCPECGERMHIENTCCGRDGCACAIYPTFHNDPKLSEFYPASELAYETRGDGLTAVRVTTPHAATFLLIRPHPVKA
jgi:hypothetical protein